MEWNLVEDLNDADPTLPTMFAPPLAAHVPEPSDNDPFELSRGLPPPDVYSFTEQHINDGANTRTTDVALRIDITPPAAGFPLDPGHPELPPPAFRFHAMARGQLSFRPASGATPAQLVLTTDVFAVMRTATVPWTQRWVEAGCIPREIIYENVDVPHLRDYLRAIPLAGSHGLTFPQSTTAPIDTNEARNDFVTTFLEGPLDPDTQRPTHFVSVKPGAFIGHAALIPGTTNETRRLTMHARYADHAMGAEQPMSPRELFHLVFGNTSPFAMNHPLLKQLDVRPVGRPFTTRDLVLRPPLRTWARVIWESEREEAIDDDLTSRGLPRRWTAAADLPADARFDTFRRQVPGSQVVRQVSYGNLRNFNKCNVFTSDVSVRAGFRAMILDTGQEWHYPLANSHTHAARNLIAATPPGPPVRLAINGQGQDRARTWGWALTRFIAAGMTRQQLNDLMTREGRVLLVACARPRKIGNGHVVAACIVGNRKQGSGHIVFAREFTAEPVLRQNPDVLAPGLPAGAQSISEVDLTSAQASSDEGARTHRRFHPQLGGVAQNAAGNLGFIRTHLLEVAPGRDPDLLQGLYDLHIIRSIPNQLQTALDRARTVRITNSNQCCIDQFPGQDTVQQGNC
jgi:hypothetical protein